MDQVHQVRRQLGSNCLRIAVMPDAHQGDSIPNGTVYLTKSPVPWLVGTDIGCGVSLFRLRVSESEMQQVCGCSAQQFTSLMGREVRCVEMKDSKHMDELGVIGGGNHFAEVVKVLEAVDDSLTAGSYLLMVHSGSRAYGSEVAKITDADKYMQAHSDCVRWAQLNRRVIAAKMMRAISDVISRNVGPDGIPDAILNITHNYIELTEDGYVHRKGAVSTNAQSAYDFCTISDVSSKIGILPGSRGTASFVLKMHETEGVHETYLRSIAHGAGRKLSRSMCKEKFGANDSYAQSTILLPHGGHSTVCCMNRNLLIQEHPDAYKQVDDVVRDLETFGMAQRLACLLPVFTYKD